MDEELQPSRRGEDIGPSDVAQETSQAATGGDDIGPSDVAQETSQAATGPAEKRRKPRVSEPELRGRKLKRIKNLVTKLSNEKLPPSCVFMYKDKKSIKCCGPGHMKKFLQDKYVLETFAEASTNRPATMRLPGTKQDQAGPSSETDEEESNEKGLRELDVREVTVPNLRVIISSIARGKKNFWKNDNKPMWWPEELPFHSPSHKGESSRKYTRDELMAIVQAYQQHLHAKIAASSTAVGTGTTPMEEGTDVGTGVNLIAASSTAVGTGTTPMEEGTDVGTGVNLIAASSTAVGTGTTPMEEGTDVGTGVNLIAASSTAVGTGTTPMEEGTDVGTGVNLTDALQLLRVTKEWTTFYNHCKELATRLSAPQASYTTYETNLAKVTRYSNMPPNYVAIDVTGNGDCLFNAVSILLTGNENNAPALRLGAATYGAIHAEHLIDQYIADGVDNVGAAHMMMHSVSTPDTVASCTGTTVKEIIRHTIQAEVRATAEMGRFSGLLQLSFLAGFTSHMITLYCEDPAMDGYHNRPMAPCGCQEPDLKGELRLMLVKKSTQLNHFVGLVKSSGRGTRQQQVTQQPMLPGVQAADLCAANLTMGCWVKKREHLAMIQCSRCKCWYHHKCVPVPESEKWEELPFVCCAQEKTAVHRTVPNITLLTNLSLLSGSPWRCLVKLDDVISLRPTYWLTSGIVDFYGRHLAFAMSERDQSNIEIMSTTFLEQLTRDAKRRKRQKGNPKQGADAILLPICRQNHWTLICITSPNDTNRTCLLVLDSLGGKRALNSTDSSAIKRYLTDVYKCHSHLQVMNVEVPLQENGTDCGPHMLYNMKWVVENWEDFVTLKAVRKVPAEPIGLYMRRQIRSDLYFCLKFTEAEPRL